VYTENVRKLRATRTARPGEGVMNLAKGKSSGRKAGGHYRSAITGRYVTAAHGRRSPRITVRESK
jgi:hypothetical protein